MLGHPFLNPILCFTNPEILPLGLTNPKRCVLPPAFYAQLPRLRSEEWGSPIPRSMDSLLTHSIVCSCQAVLRKDHSALYWLLALSYHEELD